MTDDEASDLDLASRAWAGEDRAFTALMRRHKPSLYGFVRRYVGDGDAALDVVQESFVSAWRAIGRFDGRRPFPVWLRAIALNKCRDRGRRIAVRRLILGDRDEQSAEAKAQADPRPSSEAEILSVERQRRLQRAIDLLPAKLKEPLLLIYFDELSQQEAADLLGVTVKTIETRAYRARQRLAENLDRNDF